MLTTNIRGVAGPTPPPPAVIRIGKQIWEDRNGNGEKDADDPGIPNISIDLLKLNETFDMELSDTTKSDEDGFYSFKNVEDGEYILAVDAPKFDVARYGFPGQMTSVNFEKASYNSSKGSNGAFPIVDSLPGAGVKSIWSPDGKYLVLLLNIAPYFVSFSWDGFKFTPMNNPVILPTQPITNAFWAPNSSAVVIIHTVTPYVRVIKLVGYSFGQIINPNLEAATSFFCQNLVWGPNSDRFFISNSSSTTDSLIGYTYNGTTLTRYTAPSVSPGGTARPGLAVSPNGRYVAIASSTSPYVSIYIANVGSFSSKATFNVDNTSNNVIYIKWLTDSLFLVANATSAYPLLVYSFNGSVASIYSRLTSVPASLVHASVAPNNLHVAIGLNGFPYCSIYPINVSGALGSELIRPTIMPISRPHAVEWSPDNKTLLMTASNSRNFYSVYIEGNTIMNINNPNADVIPQILNIGWSYDGEYMYSSIAAFPYIYMLRKDSMEPFNISHMLHCRGTLADVADNNSKLVFGRYNNAYYPYVCHAQNEMAALVTSGTVSSLLSLTPGVSKLNFDFAFYRPVVIGGRIFEDSLPTGTPPGNGIQDVDSSSGLFLEKGFSGWRINLLNADNTRFLDPYGIVYSVTTASNGTFIFRIVSVHHSKLIKFESIRGDNAYSVTLKNMGSNPAASSMLNSSDFCTDPFTIDYGYVNMNMNGGYRR